MTFLQALSWRPAGKPENRVFAAGMATLAVGLGHFVLEALDVFGSKALTELAAFLVCLWMFPNEPRARWTARTSALVVLLGLLGGALWIAFIGYPSRNTSQFLTWDQIPLAYYLLGVFTSCVAAPLFEEKVVRHLLLTGAAHYLGRIVASVAVSLLFAWVHPDARILAFLFSIIICACIYTFSLDTWQRAVVHGLINLSIIQWTVIYPNL